METFIKYLEETNNIPYNTKEELKAKMTVALNNLNKETVRKASRRIQNCIKEKKTLFYSIQKYFQVILENISDKMRCRCYFHFC